MWFENRLVYAPRPYPDGVWRMPGLSLEDAWFEAPDGVRLHGWYIHHPRPVAVVLHAHGNGGNLTYWTLELRRLHAIGAAVMIFDYRGYGRSEGSPHEAGILADARAARRWLAARTGTDESQIVLLGQSLGGGVMVDLAAHDGARGLILEKTFTSIIDVARHHFPIVPLRWLLRNRLDSAAKIQRYRGPLMQCHGEGDSIIPYRIGRRLYELANDPKQFFELGDAGHNDLLPDSYYHQLAQFLQGLPARA